MKKYLCAVVLLAGLSLPPSQAQQTNVRSVIYDQVTPWPGHPDGDVIGPEAGFLLNTTTEQKVVQSFTPFWPSIDFIDLKLITSPFAPHDATVLILLRSQSINGPIIASTDPVTIPPGFSNGAGSWTRFMFPSRVDLPRFETFYFEPMVLSGAVLVMRTISANTAAVLYHGTHPNKADDLFFREGIINLSYIPEPSTGWLVLCGLFVLRYALLRDNRYPRRP